MKNQLKKSLSLFMAVLMLMTCWVWIAPEKASAVETNYTVRVRVNNVNAADGGQAKIIVRYKETNGTDSTEKTKEYDMTSEMSQNEGSDVTKDITVPGFPIGIKMGFIGTQGFTYDSVEGTLNGIFIIINGGTAYQIWGVNSAISGSESNKYSKKGSGGWGSPSWAYTTEAKMGDGLAGSVNWVSPKFSEITSISATDVTVNKLPNGDSVTSTVTVTGGKDQYGVDWKASIPTSGFSYSLKRDESTALTSTYGTISGSSNSATATFYDDIQTLFPNATSGSGKVYAYATYNNGKSTSVPVNLTFPTYDITFNANGGTIGEGGVIDADGIITDIGNKYAGIIGKAPDYHEREGFDFKGYYSLKNDAATGKDASFSGTLFVDNETTVTSQGDMTYYAAWQAKPITATFVTADNQLIGTVEGRYDNYLTAGNMYNGDAGLNAAVKASHTAGKVQFNSSNQPIYTNGSTSYEFKGWRIIKSYDDSLIYGDEDTVLKGDVTFQAVYGVAGAEKYTIKFEDGKGNVVESLTQTDKNYRDEISGINYEPLKDIDDRYSYEFIGWAKKLVSSDGVATGPDFYAVDASDKDENGATVVYTHKDGAEFTVKGNATYVPVFRMIPREYKVTYNYTQDNNTPASTVIEGYNWHDSVKAPEIKDNYTADGARKYLTGWTVNGGTEVMQLEDIIVEGDMILTAVYGREELAKYTINFYGKAEDGETDVLLNEDNNIYEHKSNVTAPEVAQTIDTADSLYTFAGWSPAINTTASGDVDYYATYTKKDYADVHFYNYDGTLLYELDGKEHSLFVGDKIPAYTNRDDEGNEVLPTKAEDVVGTYNFTGWADGNGNEVVPGTDKFEGDLYLYAQYETVYKEYTVTFLNDVLDADGKNIVVSEKKYHYGEAITIPENPTKDADVEYIYDFKYWSPDVSEVCYGDAVYTAVYERNHQYYKVTWLKDNKSVHSESSYKYNAKIQQAVINAPVAYGPAATGKTWAFKHWVQCDENGNDVLVNGEQVIFVRGQRMPAEHLYFYPVFEEVDNVLTVTFYKEDGTSLLGTAEVPYGGSIADYAEEFAVKAAKKADETHHYVINNWVNVNGGASVSTITADVSVKATYTPEEHIKDVYDIIIEPTCTETGLADVSCSAEECDYVFRNVVLDVIPDTAAPSGQIYVGTDNKWTLKDFTDGIDYNDIRYVNPRTNIVVNTQDYGSRSKQNPDGLLYRGVGKIDYYVSETVIADPAAIGSWTNVYDYEATAAQVLSEVLLEKGKTMQDYIDMGRTPGNKEKKVIDEEVKSILAGYYANATGILSNLNLENGKSYIIYIRVSDREINGQSNVCYFSSGTISYGSTAATVTVSGDGYGTKFCADATISVTDDSDGFKVYLDGVEITLDASGTYKCEEKGVHTVTVVDRHGNNTTKTFEIKGNHSYRNYTIAASCENAGSRYDLCTLCGAKANETVLPALGHSYTSNYIDKDPTCVDDGYRTYVCDNNCGTKLVLKPTDDADTIAAAKKYNETTEDYTDTLTADDLKHLKATGVHTYAKVKDENGNDTAEDAWVVDKAATCITVGSKHKDCTKCGETVTAEIPLDTENGHKFYREKVTLEPTCTTKGEKTKTCRYCGTVVKVADIDALGHVAGEYRVITAATCETVGSKILTCSTCGVDIGEPVKDKEGEFDGKAVEIPALGHAWKLDGEVWLATEENDDPEKGIVAGKYYQNYVCKNDETHKKTEEVEDYQPPVEATVTFDFNGGYFTVPAQGNPNELGYVPEMLKGTQKITAYVGESIAASEVEAAFKLDNATKTYKFAYWATKNADGTYTEVKFPIAVEGDATYYAVYTEKYVTYTAIFYKEDGITEYKKVGYLHNGDEVELPAGPAKEGDWQYTYKFLGWAKYEDVYDEETDTTSKELVVQKNAVVEGANISLQAVYEKVTRKYAVTYAYSQSNILETFEVVAGDAARSCAITPVKAADSKYHYDFKAWNRADQLKSVESNIYTTPDFEAELHEFKETTKVPATCTTNKISTFTCDCGYTYDKEIPNTALSHNWGTPVEGEGGKLVATCQNEGCGATQEDTRVYIVKFLVDGEAVMTVRDIPWGSKVTALPTNPTKEATVTTEYTFKGWALKGDATQAIVDVKAIEIKQDYDFVAVFTEKTRTYTVIFAYDAHNVIETHTDVPAGSTVSFEGATPVKAPDVNYHYTFDKWSGSTADIKGDVYVTAVFKKHNHSYSESELNEATCQNGEGTRYWCDCNANGKLDDKANGEFVDHYYDVTGKPLPHDFDVIERVEATEKDDGYIKYQCKNCGETKTEKLEYVDNVISIQVTITYNGVAKSGVQVEIQPADGVSFFATTNTNGVANADGTKGVSYVAYATIDGEKVQVALSADANGNLSGSYNHVDADVDCSCACHRDNIWGAIFRFFHKIIKLFTGEFKCCGNPDPMYG